MKTEKNSRLAWRLKDLSTATGLSVPMLRKLIRSGRLRARKIGNCVIILDEDARAFLAGAENETSQNRFEHARSIIGYQ